jgi:redox-sensitive bicupin YhaK (pirin superfamily)
VPPRYIGLQRDEIPAVKTPDDKGTVNLVSGQWNGQAGAMQPLYDVLLSWVELAAGGQAVFPDVAGRNVFLYVVRGTVRIAGEDAAHYHLIELTDDGDTVEVTAESDAVLLVGHAVPLGEPVVSYGPFVMNTQQEIMQALNDYRAGKFNDIPSGTRVA